MRSLFLRIFLWHWLTIAGLTAALWATQMVIAPNSGAERTAFLARGEMFSFGQTAAGLYVRNGCPGVQRLMSRFAAMQAGGPRLLLDENGRPLCVADGVTAAEVERLGLGARAGRFVPQGRQTWLAVQFAGMDGKHYLAAGAFPRVRLWGGALFTRRRLYSLLFVFCLSGVMAWILAHYLSRPVRRLRAVTSQFASGDLKARIDDASILRRGDEVSGLARDFDRMAEQIEQLVAGQHRSLAQQRALFFDISHELRSPLTRLVVASSLLRRNQTAESAPFLDRIDREAARIDNLVGQLLTLARLESATSLEGIEEISLGELLSEIAADARFEAVARSCSVRLTVVQDCIVHGTPSLLRSALENVVRNAVRYTSPATEIGIDLAAEQAHAVVTVSDEGPGVPEPELAHLFEPFFRAAAAREHTADGIGLGLAITRRAIEMHGGTVQAFSRTPRGLAVRMVLDAV